MTKDIEKVLKKYTAQQKFRLRDENNRVTRRLLISSPYLSKLHERIEEVGLSPSEAVSEAQKTSPNVYDKYRWLVYRVSLNYANGLEVTRCLLKVENPWDFNELLDVLKRINLDSHHCSKMLARFRPSKSVWN